MYDIIKTRHKPLFVWNKEVKISSDAIAQGTTLASLPFVHNHVVMLPNAHTSTGTATGSVVATDRAIIPAAIGDDIGCGMMAFHTNIREASLPNDLKQLRNDLKQ